MAIKTESQVAIESNFNLKNVLVELVPANPAVRRADISLAQLEAMRTGSRPVPASKHGLENICGASCETGAQ